MKMQHFNSFDRFQGAADRDGNEMQDIRREQDFRQGRRPNYTDSEHHRIGSFERHTKVMKLLMFNTCINIFFRESVGVYWNEPVGKKDKV